VYAQVGECRGKESRKGIQGGEPGDLIRKEYDGGDSEHGMDSRDETFSGGLKNQGEGGIYREWKGGPLGKCLIHNLKETGDRKEGWVKKS